MIKVTKVAISLPERVLSEVEKVRKSRGETRSEFFRRAAEKLLKQEQEFKEIAAYIHGYRANPETVEEVEVAHATGKAVLSGEPWQ